MAPPAKNKTGGDAKDFCNICGQLYKEHSFAQLRECWHKARGYAPDQYKPDPRYQKGMDRT
mgnify:FL=1|tara:strand:+ start:295 stop:477 length:183 start_codon:yes stop_codon:yes gene_type:complete